MTRLLGLLLALLWALMLSSCGGGVGSGGTGSIAGIGSGGTGAVAISAVAVGPIEGFGSIIVNGIRYDTSAATISLSDASELKLGMTVHVTGSLNAELSQGVATDITSAPELRGNASTIDSAARSLRVASALVTTDDATIFEGSAGLAALVEGDAVQVYGLAGTGGTLRATRIEKLASGAAPILTGAIQNFDGGRRSFSLGTVRVDFANAAVDTAGMPALTDGVIVTVRGTFGSDGALAASAVQASRATSVADGSPMSLAGLVTDYAGAASFRIQGVTVNASDAKITGGPSGALAPGVRLEVAGTLRGGVLRADTVRIRNVAGTGETVSFSASGTVSKFRSPASFQVQGQQIDAGASGVVFVNGSALDLRAGRKVSVTGSRVVDGVLIADQVRFTG